MNNRCIMADFKTHTIAAAAVSGAMTTVLLVRYQISVELALLYWATGTLGGILPDIDSDHSKSIQLIFGLMAGLGTVIGVILLHPFLNIWQLYLAGVACYLLIYFPIRHFFATLTIHRGILHSLLANLLFALITVVLGYHLLGMTATIAWGCALFVFCGALVHLLLDECYSVDLSGVRLKNSFGSALKLTYWRSPWLSVGFVIACGGLYLIAPSGAFWWHLLRTLMPL